MGIYGSSGKTINPLAGVGVLAGVVGASCSVVLWIYRYRPSSRLLGHYGAQIAYGGTLPDQLRLLAAIGGVMAIIASIMSSLGGRGRASTVAAIFLGIVALSYPVLTWLNVVTRLVPNPVK